jgi:PAB1-binding protein PBP1
LRTNQSLKSLEEMLVEKEKLLEDYEQKFLKASSSQPPFEIDEEIVNQVSQGKKFFF